MTRAERRRLNQLLLQSKCAVHETEKKPNKRALRKALLQKEVTVGLDDYVADHRERDKDLT